MPDDHHVAPVLTKVYVADRVVANSIVYAGHIARCRSKHRQIVTMVVLWRKSAAGKGSAIFVGNVEVERMLPIVLMGNAAFVALGSPPLAHHREMQVVIKLTGKAPEIIDVLVVIFFG